MNREHINVLEDLIITFLTFSDKWLQDGIIDQDTYLEIRKEKIKFIETIKSKEK